MGTTVLLYRKPCEADLIPAQLIPKLLHSVYYVGTKYSIQRNSSHSEKSHARAKRYFLLFSKAAVYPTPPAKTKFWQGYF